jgi:hypothetical protein
MKRLNVSKYLFYTMSIILVLGLSFTFGLYSGAKKTIVFKTLSALKNKVEEAITLVSGEVSTLSRTHPANFLQPGRYKGAGVTVNDRTTNEHELILIASFFDRNNELRLIRRNGSIVARWPVRFSEIFPDTSHMVHPVATDWNIDIDSALALPDGSVVLNFAYGGLVKLDRCGNIVWKLARQSHHSVELAEGGGFWVPGLRYYPEGTQSPFPQFQTPFNVNTIMKVSNDGKVLKEISVPKLFYDNGLEAVLTANRILTYFVRPVHQGGEIVHLNKIGELPSAIAEDFPMFEAGDLLLSLAHLNMVLVIDPDTAKIKWWQIGPWLRQHDPEFKPGGTIIVFNNKIKYYLSHKTSPQASHANLLTYGSNIIEFDPVSNKNRIIYGDKMGQEMATIDRGKHELTRGGGLLITEYRGGRVFETDASGNKIWEYINRYDSDEVAKITEARIYPVSYFNVMEWSCE